MCNDPKRVRVNELGVRVMLIVLRFGVAFYDRVAGCIEFKLMGIAQSTGSYPLFATQRTAVVHTVIHFTICTA
jgi:hypothetical protein